MAEASAGSPSARQRHSWRRPPAWPDGRLLHPREDLTTRVTIGAIVPLLAIWVWALALAANAKRANARFATTQ